MVWVRSILVVRELDRSEIWWFPEDQDAAVDRWALQASWFLEDQDCQVGRVGGFQKIKMRQLTVEL